MRSYSAPLEPADFVIKLDHATSMFTCPITNDLFYKPAMLMPCKHLFEEAEITASFNMGARNCPVCREESTHIESVPPILGEMYALFLSQNPALHDQRGLSIHTLKALLDKQNLLPADENRLLELLTHSDTIGVVRSGENESWLFNLTRFSCGRQLIAKNPNLRAKITVVGLNAVVAEGPTKGTSPLWCLVGTPEGTQILATDADLRAKITAVGLNAIIAEGLNKGKCPLVWLVSNPEGRQMLATDADLRAKITAVGLNAIIAEGPNKGQSALWYLAGTSEGSQILATDADLRAKITAVGLNAVVAEGPDKGMSALWYLAGTPEGRQILATDADLRAKITAVGLNAVVEKGVIKECLLWCGWLALLKVDRY